MKIIERFGWNNCDDTIIILLYLYVWNSLICDFFLSLLLSYVLLVINISYDLFYYITDTRDSALRNLYILRNIAAVTITFMKIFPHLTVHTISV